MANERSSNKFELLKSIIGLKCPQCRQDSLFKKRGLFVYKGLFSMPIACGNCNLKFEIEPGFWYGALWASYPILIVVEFPFLLLALFATWGNHWSPLIAMVIVFLVLWPAFIRLGRSIWIHVWVKFNPNG